MIQPKTNKSGLFRAWGFAIKTLPNGQPDVRVWVGKVLGIDKRLTLGAKVLLRNSSNETTIVIYTEQFNYE